MLGVAIACLNAYLTQERLDADPQAADRRRHGRPRGLVRDAEPVERLRPEARWTVLRLPAHQARRSSPGPRCSTTCTGSGSGTPSARWRSRRCCSACAATGRGGRASSGSCGPLQWMGRLSYTLYIWHALPYLLIFALTGGEDAVARRSRSLRTPILIASAFLFVDAGVLPRRAAGAEGQAQVLRREGSARPADRQDGPGRSRRPRSAKRRRRRSSRSIGPPPTASVGSDADDRGWPNATGAPGGPGAPVV